MFEKFSIVDIDSAGRGGEYTVQVRAIDIIGDTLLKLLQAGFGWTNGVVLWVASQYGAVLNAPVCPELAASTSTTGGGGTGAASPRATVEQGTIVSVLVGSALLSYALIAF